MPRAGTAGRGRGTRPGRAARRPAARSSRGAAADAGPEAGGPPSRGYSRNRNETGRLPPMVDASTILLVDDEEAVRRVLSFPLERDGYTVVQAGDGEEALRRFGDAPVDLVVLDVMLPRLDGLEVCRRLRATSSVPIIMLTARDDELDKVVGLELGADDYITKPFSIREFRSRVRALLRRAKASRALEQ